MDEIIAASGVAKATLYRHFRTKNDLVLAVLDHRNKVWTQELLDTEARLRGGSPEGQLLAIFDVLHEWFQRKDHASRTFIHVLLEMGAEHPIGRAVVGHLSSQRAMIERTATEAGLRAPADFATEWHVLMNGTIIAASEGNPDASAVGKRMAGRLIEDHRVARTATVKQTKAGRTTAARRS